MKIYIDELPKKCEDCPFCKLDTYVDVYGYQTNSHECVLDGSMLTNSCPLQSLADHDNQIRKQVCEEFREIVRQKYPICYINMREKLFNSDEITISFKKVSEILDQIKEKRW